MKIHLLTHQRELARKTNTGNLAIKTTDGLVERVIWDRLHPDNKLVELIESNSVTLLYPSSEAKPLSLAGLENIIIIDATWQEARKIYNQSPYLKGINKATLNSNKISEYKLRRNQPEDGLCTIECVIEILKLQGQNQLSKSLACEFDSFNKSKK